MAHKEQREYCQQVKNLYPEYFDGVYVLDAGSLDVNGNNQFLFNNTHYVGIDISEGKNVDIVSKIHELQLPDDTFDTIICTEVFEHDKYYAESVKNIYRMIKPGGMFLFTCATTGRPEHGTKRTRPQDAPLLQNDEEWQDYYKNLTQDDIKEVLDVDNDFYKYQFIVNSQSCDLYFWGIKNGIWNKRKDRSYHIANGITKTFNNDYIIQLFMNTGNGFTQKESIKIPYEQQTTVSFDVKAYPNMNAVRFDPLDDYAIVKIKSIFLDDQEYKHILKTNAFYNQGQVYYFFTKDANIFLDTSSIEGISEIKVDLEYLYTGQYALKQFPKIVAQLLESRDQDIEGLKEEVESKDQSIEGLKEEVESKDQDIQGLKRQNNSLKQELTLVYTSKSWKITRPIRKLLALFHS